MGDTDQAFLAVLCHSTRSFQNPKSVGHPDPKEKLISSWVPRESSTSYSLCAENGQVLNIKESEGVYGKEKIWIFIGHSAPFCFLDQSSPEGLAEVALCLSSLTPA